MQTTCLSGQRCTTASHDRATGPEAGAQSLQHNEWKILTHAYGDAPSNGGIKSYSWHYDLANLLHEHCACGGRLPQR
jgi:hypothetical protein